MVAFRPHIMNWTTTGSNSVKDPETGYLTPGAPGQSKSVGCRFHLGGVKEFKNQDNTTRKQIGTIRMDAGSDAPEIGQDIEVIDELSDEVVFSGPVMEFYPGQLSWRIEV